MPDERYVEMTVECQHCKTLQKVHIATSTCGTLIRERTISCINCSNYIRVKVPDKIVDGPFPV
jgi:hypothetical protein